MSWEDDRLGLDHMVGSDGIMFSIAKTSTGVDYDHPANTDASDGGGRPSSEPVEIIQVQPITKTEIDMSPRDPIQPPTEPEAGANAESETTKAGAAAPTEAEAVEVPAETAPESKAVESETAEAESAAAAAPEAAAAETKNITHLFAPEVSFAEAAVQGSRELGIGAGLRKQAKLLQNGGILDQLADKIEAQDLSRRQIIALAAALKSNVGFLEATFEGKKNAIENEAAGLEDKKEAAFKKAFDSFDGVSESTIAALEAVDSDEVPAIKDGSLGALTQRLEKFQDDEAFFKPIFEDVPKIREKAITNRMAEIDSEQASLDEAESDVWEAAQEYLNTQITVTKSHVTSLESELTRLEAEEAAVNDADTEVDRVAAQTKSRIDHILAAIDAESDIEERTVETVREELTTARRDLAQYESSHKEIAAQVGSDEPFDIGKLTNENVAAAMIMEGHFSGISKGLNQIDVERTALKEEAGKLTIVLESSKDGYKAVPPEARNIRLKWPVTEGISWDNANDREGKRVALHMFDDLHQQAQTTIEMTGVRIPILEAGIEELTQAQLEEADAAAATVQAEYEIRLQATKDAIGIVEKLKQGVVAEAAAQRAKAEAEAEQDAEDIQTIVAFAEAKSVTDPAIQTRPASGLSGAKVVTIATDYATLAKRQARGLIGELDDRADSADRLSPIQLSEKWREADESTTRSLVDLARTAGVKLAAPKLAA